MVLRAGAWCSFFLGWTRLVGWRVEWEWEWEISGGGGGGVRVMRMGEVG